MLKATFTTIFLLFSLTLSVVCHGAQPSEKKKILYINSYHQGYQWSDEIEKGVLKVLNVSLAENGDTDSSKSDIELRIFRMNTKLQPDQNVIKQTAAEVKAIVSNWQPDIILASDDNAVKHVVARFFKNKTIPVVFSGVNWDASIYGLPVNNITGMVEVAPIAKTITMLESFTTGKEVGYLGADNMSNRKALENHTKILGLNYSEGQLCSSYTSWTQAYITLQQKVDILILFSPIGIPDWDDKKAEKFVLHNTTIPSGATDTHTSRFTLLGRIKLGEEQGWWMANTALSILNGTSPADIPLTQNTRSRLLINMKMARHLGLKIPMDLLEHATIISNQKNK